MARATLDLVADQLERGLRVAVASPPDDTFMTAVTARGADHIAWPAVRAPGPSSLAETKRLARSIARIRPDLVHLHSSKAGLAGRVALRGRLPTIFQPHAWSFDAVEGIHRRGALAWERTGARWAHVIVCVSEAERRRAEAVGVRGHFEVIANGVDLTRFRESADSDRFDARRRLGLGEGFVVLCVGRLSRQKGQDVLLAAWPEVARQAPDALLVLVGDGPDRERLRTGAPDGVLFAGARSDVPDWLAAADVVAVPSRWDGLSIALLEAMARGRSVVATDATGAAEALGPNAGTVVPIDDATALAEAIVRRLRDRDLIRSEGREARRRAALYFDVRRTTAAMAALYERQLSGHGLHARRTVEPSRGELGGQ